MLFSRERRVLFVHIQKTGGKTIEHILYQRTPDLQKVLGMHDHAKWAKPQMPPDVWDSLFKFAFVRNPWDRLVSWYSMIRQSVGAQPPHERNKLRQYVLDNAPTFTDFIVRCTATITENGGVKSFLFNQLDYITDEQGNVIVDFVGKYENFVPDLQLVLDRLDIDCDIPHANPSRHDHYSHYYTDETRQIVAERYARDIAYFGYQFETA